MRPLTFTVNLAATSVTKVAASQTPGGAGAITLAAAASAIDPSGAGRILLITTGEDDTAITYVITGLDADGNAITETSTLPNHTTKVSTNAYASVSSFTVSGALTAAMSVGTVGSTLSAISKTYPLDFYMRNGATVATEVTGTIVYSVRETFDDVLGSGTGSAIWFSGSLNTDTQNTSGTGTVGANLLSLSSTSGRSQLDKGVTGMDISIASYSTGATLTVRVISEDNR